MSSFPKGRPPASMTILERWIYDKAREDGIVPERIRRGISFMVVSAALARLTDRDGVPLFLVKGGVSMQLRFGIRARASKDYDAAFREDLAALEDVLARAPSQPIGPFTVSAGPIAPIGPTDAVRALLTIRFANRAWGSIPLEVSKAEGRSGRPQSIDYRRPTPDISLFGLETIDDIPCFPVRYQIAQKLHACTEVLEHKDNDRFRDLIDLLLLEELVGEAEWPAVRAACEETFAIRAKHSWPPTVTIFPAWPDGFAALAAETGFEPSDVGEAAARIEAMISRISVAPR